MELLFWIVPEEKRKKKHRTIALIVAIFMLMLYCALAIWGVYLLNDKQNLWGILPLTVAIVLSLAQIVCGILLQVRKRRKR